RRGSDVQSYNAIASPLPSVCTNCIASANSASPGGSNLAQGESSQRKKGWRSPCTRKCGAQRPEAFIGGPKRRKDEDDSGGRSGNCAHAGQRQRTRTAA